LQNNSLFSNTYADLSEYQTHFEEKELFINDTTIGTFYLPKEKEKSYVVNKRTPDFILILSKIEVSVKYYWVDYFLFYGQPGFLLKKRFVKQEIHYLVWDNSKNNIVSYGKSHSKLLFDELEKEYLADLINGNIKDIIKNSPFKKKRYKW
jgi:hypothetical protein